MAATVLLAGCAGGALRPRGDAAESLARLWWFMLVAGGAVHLIVTVVMLVGVVRRRADAGNRDRTDRRFIVWGGIILPAAVLSALLSVTIITLQALPKGQGTVDIQVIGHQFWWEVRYPGGIVTANELHIPVSEEVRVHLSSDDVIHSFWVPELAGKRDLIPGRDNVLVLNATEPGVYRGQCAEFCGIQHANMAFHVVAHTPTEFAAWTQAAAEPAAEPTTPAARRGQDEFAGAGCAACHTIRGTSADGDVGPDLTHFASRRTIGAGTVENDRGHLGGWVVDSQTIKPGNLMPPQDVDPRRLNDLLDYLQALR